MLQRNINDIIGANRQKGLKYHMEQRIDKVNYYLNIAKAVADRSTCLRKHVGCVIVNNDEIISTGYNGAPRGRKNCNELGYCTKKKFFPNLRHAGYDACRSVHAEQNAIISARRKDMIGATLYLTIYNPETGEYENGSNSCQMCRKLIINADIEKIIVGENNEMGYKIIDIQEWIDNDDLLEGKITY